MCSAAFADGIHFEYRPEEAKNLPKEAHYACLVADMSAIVVLCILFKASSLVNNRVLCGANSTGCGFGAVRILCCVIVGNIIHEDVNSFFLCLANRAGCLVVAVFGVCPFTPGVAGCIFIDF